MRPLACSTRRTCVDTTEGEAVAGRAGRPTEALPAPTGAFSCSLAASTALRLFSSSRFCIRSTASFSARGKSGAGSPNWVPAFNPPHARSVRNALLCRVCDLAQPKLPPDLGGGVGQDGIDQRGDDADGLGSRRQHARLQLLRVRLRSGRQASSRGRSRSDSRRSRRPEPTGLFSASEKFSSSNAGANSAMVRSALSRSAVSAAVSAPVSGTTPPKYLCTMLTTRLTRLP